jgi:hypothetical protein
MKTPSTTRRQALGLPLLCAAGFAMASSPLGRARAADGAELLRRADRFRSPDGSFTFEASIVPPRGANLTMEVMVRDRARSLVLYRDPAHLRGQAVLLVERNMWVKMPNARRVLRVAPQQRVAGAASYTDIARIVFSDDYDVAEVGPVRSGRRVLVLVPRGPGVAYARIDLVVTDAEGRPVSAAYFAAGASRVMKTAHFENFRDVLGFTRTTRMRAVDHMAADEVTLMDFSGHAMRSLPDTLFRPSHLETL